MSIQTQIDRLNTAKVNLKAWLENSGITVPTSALLDEMIALLPTGGVTPTIKNWVKYATESNGTTIYNNGLGYKDGYRLSSSASEKTQDYSTLTGYIPCTKTDILRLTGVKFASYSATGGMNNVGGHGITGVGLYSYLAIYNSNKTLLHSMQCESIFDNGIQASGWTFPLAQDTDIITFDFSNYTGSDMAFVRINAIGSGANMVVTKNQEIV